MLIHIVGYPHTNTDGTCDMCGFTNKTMRFCRMMKGLGHTVIHYGGIRSTAECDEYVPIVTEYEQLWVREEKHYIYPSWNPKHAVWVLFNERVAREIKRRGAPGDIVCVLGGNIFLRLEELLPDYKVCEYGIGYVGYGLKYKVWESKAWKEIMALMPKHCPPQPEDPVIHSFFDPAEFRLGQDKGYLLYVGRLTEQKGVPLACEAAWKAGKKLYVIGHGDKKLVTHGAEYLGEVSMARRNELIEGADALICPTQKFEAFGNIVPEAGMCGTRVISSDSGAFKETVLDGFTGWRCATVEEMVRAIQRLFMLGSREAIRKSAIERFGMWNLAPRYEEYFNSIK